MEQTATETESASGAAAAAAAAPDSALALVEEPTGLQFRFSEPLISYNGEDRQNVLHRDLTLPHNQNVALISYLENDPRALRVHGCFKNNEAAKEYMENLVDEMTRRNLPVPSKTAIVDLGFWKPWPPRSEYVEKTTVCDAALDPVLKNHFENRKKARKQILENAFNSESSSVKDMQILAKQIDSL
jgi:hypothetical protein